MFDDLDSTLQRLLLQELKAEYPDLTAENISFAAPDADLRNSVGNRPTIDLFLYDIRENWGLRQSGWSDRVDDNGAASKRVRQRAPARVDCAYIITAWLAGADPAALAEEHRLLGYVMAGLLRHRQLPADLLFGELQGAEPPVRGQVTQQGQLQSLGEFWQAMGGKPKAALHYTVTLSLDLFPPEDLGPPVMEKVLKVRQGAEKEAP